MKSVFFKLPIPMKAPGGSLLFSMEVPGAIEAGAKRFDTYEGWAFAAFSEKKKTLIWHSTGVTYDHTHHGAIVIDISRTRQWKLLKYFHHLNHAFILFVFSRLFLKHTWRFTAARSSAEPAGFSRLCDLGAV